MATKVKIREKAISGNRLSLYLDLYPAIPDAKTGKLTRREFLGLYIHLDKSELKNKIRDKEAKGENADKLKMIYKSLKPLSPIDKLHNKETLQLAEQIRQKRENRINKPEVYSKYEQEQLELKKKSEQSFIEYFKKLMDKRKASNHDNWAATYKYLLSFTKGALRFADVTERLCNDFKEYLLTTKSNKSHKTTLSQNSAVSYFNKLKATLKQAYKDGYLQADINAKVEPIKQAETRRNFLGVEELNSLIKTKCNNPLLKRAALFSALTGLRFSDIQKLTWREVHFVEDYGYCLQFKQQKTQGMEVLPISEQAYNLLGERQGQDDKVFKGLTYSAYENKHLYQWIGAAGITKDITFHCFRHTFATLQLSKGTDIYTVSKMLGHRELKTTQIYAKVIDQSKREAANKIQLEF